MSLIVGLTGGIGSGKTTVGALFAKLGVPVYNSDLEARRLMQESAYIREEIFKLIGKGAYRGKEPDRAFIASRVFGSAELLAQLNAIIHPQVGKDFRRWANNQEAPYLIQEAAVLFENGSYKKFDKIILVTAPREERIRRIMNRDHRKRDVIEARMEHQWEDMRKVPLSDFVIENLDLQKTRLEVKRIHCQLMEISG